METHVSKMIGFVEAFKLFWINYFNFSERSRRSEYWFWMLWNFIIQIALNLVDFALGLNRDFVNTAFGITTVFEIASFIPLVAITVRRFHDVGQNRVIPIIFYSIFFIDRMTQYFDSAMDSDFGLIVSIILTLLEVVFGIYVFVISLIPSNKGDNQYGPEPVGQQYKNVVNV